MPQHTPDRGGPAGHRINENLFRKQKVNGFPAGLAPMIIPGLWLPSRFLLFLGLY